MTYRRVQVTVRTIDGGELSGEASTRASEMPGAAEGDILNRLLDDHSLVVCDWTGRDRIVLASAVVWFSVGETLPEPAEQKD